MRENYALDFDQPFSVKYFLKIPFLMERYHENSLAVLGAPGMKGLTN